MKHLTIRNVPDDLAARLVEEKQARGRSLNQTVLELLAQSVGLVEAVRRSNGLEAFAGTWSQEDFEEFEESIRFTHELDDELWR